MQEFLTIGEIGALFNLNVQTLHYYDSIGLFQPALRDPNTGYRKYQFDQVYQLASIRYMRKMGYSLEEIRNFLRARQPKNTIELLKERSKALHAQWSELIQIDNAIQRKIQFMENKLRNLDLDAVEVRWFPRRRYIPIGGEELLYYQDSFYFYPTIAFYEENLKYFGALIDLPEGGEELEIAPENTAGIPAGKYLVGYHKGPYETVEQRFCEMRRGLEGLPVTGLTINFNIIDQFVEHDSQNYITEIQIQLAQS
ncbi:MAG: MerR family transcriptional regulator [Oscillospiraceae bacterium]